MSSPQAKKIEKIAHRGYSAIAPENTLAAFTAALEHQADSIEFDVQLSADRVPVIIHDYTLERTSNGSGQVQDQTLAELRSLDIGSWFGSAFANQKILTLPEALAALKDIPKHIYTEIKNAHLWNQPDIDNLVQIIQQPEWQSKCIVISFDDDFLQRVRDCSQEIAIGYLVAKPELYAEKLSKAAANQAMIMSLYKLFLENPELIATSRDHGVDIAVWTVDRPEDWHKLVALGIERITTNTLIKDFTS